MNADMIKTTIKYIINYVLFFWSIAWRTLALSMFTAILTGFGLAVVTITNNLSPEFINTFAPMVGLPITLLVGIFVVSERMLKVKKTIS